MKRIILAFDSFKGSLSSKEAADAFEEGLLSVMPEAEIHKITIADGGEGTMEALVEMLGGRIIDIYVCDPIGRKTKACYAIIDEGKTAIIEMAQASGLTLLNDEERNPLLTSTYGTGQMIADALDRGCRKIMLGIGGSATNDGGTGMMEALGYRFTDSNGNPLKGCGKNLERICSIDSSKVHPAVAEAEWLVACDVNNPLYGPNGAAYVFAAQKGADRKMIEQLDRGLRNYAKAIIGFNGTDVQATAGSGAAGGMGAALTALLHARLSSGIGMVLDAIGFDIAISGASLVVTGEGKIDRQTLMGKAPGGILQRAAAQGIPTIAVGGTVEWCDELRSCGFAKIIELNKQGLPLDMAMRHDTAWENMRNAAKELLLTDDIL